MTILHLGTRKSALALWQAMHVRDLLLTDHPDLAINVVSMTTEGDRLLDKPLITAGGKALFTKELEQNLLSRRTDIAVHSMKDVSTELPEGLMIGAVLAREDPRDALVSLKFSHLADLPIGSRIGTASLRRISQLRHIRADLVMETLRGNVNTRLDHLDRGDFDAIILAAAGLKRLGLSHRIRAFLDIETCLPAAAQGAIGIECRSDDAATRALLAPLNDPTTVLCIEAERAVTAALAGGCRLPVAAFATVVDGMISIQGRVGDPDGTRILRAQRAGPVDQRIALGQAVAADLREQGAQDILDRLLGVS